MPTVAFTVDLDPTPAYYAIHGLPWNGGADPILRDGLRRLIDLLKEEGIPATLFVTGGSLGPGEWALLRDAAAAGCELADHSFSHDYRRSLRPQEDIVMDLKRNSFAIREATGVTPRGFRAPGYKPQTREVTPSAPVELTVNLEKKKKDRAGDLEDPFAK